MAEPDAASTTGAQFGPDLRRRNVPGADKASILHSPDMADEQKKSRHVVWYCSEKLEPATNGIWA